MSEYGNIEKVCRHFSPDSAAMTIMYDDAGFTIKIDNRVFETDYCGWFNEDMGKTLVEVFKHLGYEVEEVNHFEHDEDAECVTCNG